MDSRKLILIIFKLIWTPLRTNHSRVLKGVGRIRLTSAVRGTEASEHSLKNIQKIVIITTIQHEI